MDAIKSIINIVTRNCFMATIDLKSAYYSVSINRLFQKFLKSKWQDKVYCFTCFPNGLGSWVSEENIHKTKRLYDDKLGFVKSQIASTPKIRILGFVIGSVKMIFTLTKQKN